MILICNNANFEPFEESMTQSAEDIGMCTNVVAPIDDALRNCSNIQNRVSVYESFQLSPQILTHGDEIGEPWWPFHRCPSFNPANANSTVEILANSSRKIAFHFALIATCRDKLPEGLLRRVPSNDPVKTVGKSGC